MLDTDRLFELLAAHGIGTFCGVPCSYLKPLINGAINRGRWIAAVNEGDAVATVTGLALGGCGAAVLMQNSGLTNAVSPLSSLNHTFRRGILGFVSLRGEPGLPDEPQHELMGVITCELLELLQVSWEFLSDSAEEAERQIVRAKECIRSGRSFFLVVRKNTLSPQKLSVDPRDRKTDSVTPSADAPDRPPERPSRLDALRELDALRDGRTAFLASTGFVGRELFQIEDAPSHLYMVGSMGCIGSLGLGLALARPDVRVVVLDGDGALLMRLGSLAACAFYRPPNLLHVLFDNNAHESTGGQFTFSHAVDLPGVASACGYGRVRHPGSLAGFRSALAEWADSPALTYLHLDVARDPAKELVRPDITPKAVADRLQGFLEGIPRP